MYNIKKVTIIVTFFIFYRIISMKKNNTNNRSNDFEQQTMQLIKSIGNVHIVHENLSRIGIKIIKESNKDNILFTDAGSIYLTDFGNQKRTEFVYHNLLNRLNWRIECKARKHKNTVKLISDILYPLNFVKNIDEDLFCLILSDNLDIPYITNQISQAIKEKNIKHKVWYGTLNQFTTMFKQKLN